MGWLIRGHAPWGVTAPPPPCTPRDTARWRHRWAAGVLATGPLSPDAALGGHRSVRKVGMGRAAAGSPCRCRQRRRLPGRRRRRRALGRRKAPAYDRRRTRPRRKEPVSESLRQAHPAAWKSNYCVEYQDPVRAGPPPHGGGVPRPLGNLVGSPALRGSWCLQLKAPCAPVACTFEEEEELLPFSCPGVLSFSAEIHLGSPAVGTWLDGSAGVFGPRGAPAAHLLRCLCLAVRLP